MKNKTKQGTPPKSQQDGLTVAHNVPKDIGQKSAKETKAVSELTDQEFIQFLAVEFSRETGLTLEKSYPIMQAEFKKAQNHYLHNNRKF